jgi:D-alanine-D-alanine ligase-like ATP-grasp enzyme
MRICVLQPSYEGSSFDYRHYDPPRDLSHLLPEHDFHHEFLNKVSTFSQIKALQQQGFDVFVNLCEGYRDSDVPSIDVIHALEDLNLPFTGPTSRLYDPSKDLMKLVALSSGVGVPAWQLVGPADGVKAAASTLRFPLFVKPSAYGDSMGIDEHSLVASPDELEHQVAAKLPGFGRLLVEEYVDGREFTVLVLASRDPGVQRAVHRARTG